MIGLGEAAPTVGAGVHRNAALPGPRSSDRRDETSVVDILLPLRDGVATLAETLDSVRGQTLQTFRCLVLDDGSTDGGPDLARDLAEHDDRFTVHTYPPRGISATLNDGLSRVDAPFLARIDADDRMHPERLARQVRYLDEHPDTDVVSSRVEFFGERVSDNLRAYEAWLNATMSHEEIVADLFVESPLPHPSIAMRTASLRSLGGYRERNGPEDYDLWLRGYRAGWRFAKLASTLTSIRDHGGRLTKTDPRYTTRAFLECKAEHLVEARRLAGRPIVVWGAGRDGKRAAKALRRRGAVLRSFVDIAPTKLGRRILGAPVLPPESLRDGPRAFVVAAVGVRGARAEIRAALTDLGYREELDFVCFG